MVYPYILFLNVYTQDCLKGRKMEAQNMGSEDEA